MVPGDPSKFIAMFPLCPVEKSALILTHFRTARMSSSLLSLTPELVYRIIKDLPIEDALNFLLSCRQIYSNGKYAFDEKCFHVFPVKLKSQSLRIAKDIIKKEQCRFIRKIFIQLDRVHVPLYLERPQEIVRNYLYKILKRGLHPSTKCDTIIINYGLETEENEYRHHIKAVAWAIKKASSRQGINHFKVRIQNITVPSCRDLINFGRTLLHQVHSIEVKVNSLDQDLDPIHEVLSRATNLKELSIRNDESEFLDPDVISEVIGVNSELDSLRLSGFEISTEQLQGALIDVEHYIKNINLQRMMFVDGFSSFINYISTLSLNEVFLEDIWERDFEGGECAIRDPMSYL